MRPPAQRGLQDKEQTPCGGPGFPRTQPGGHGSGEHEAGSVVTATRPVQHGRCGTGRARLARLARRPLPFRGCSSRKAAEHTLHAHWPGSASAGAPLSGAPTAAKEGKNVSPAAPPPGGPGPRRRLSSALTVPAAGAHAPLGLPVPSVARGLIRPRECPHFTGEETEHRGGAPRRPGAGSDPSHAHAASLQIPSA